VHRHGRPASADDHLVAVTGVALLDLREQIGIGPAYCVTLGRYVQVRKPIEDSGVWNPRIVADPSRIERIGPSDLTELVSDVGPPVR